MTRLPPMVKWPHIPEGQFILSLEFDHQPTVVLPEFYRSGLEARSAAKDQALANSAIRTIALIGHRYNGEVGVLDVLEGNIWSSEEAWEDDDTD